MRAAAALLAGLFLAGCLTTGRGKSSAIMIGGNDTQEVPVAAPAPDAEVWASIRRSVDVLQAQGRIAVNVEVYWPDESAAVGVLLEATDPTFRKSLAPVGADGVARLDLSTLNAQRWRAGYAGVWLTLGAPQMTPDPSGQPVIRGLLFLPAPPAFQVAVAPASPQSTSNAGAPAFYYPTEAGTSRIERVAWLKRERLKAAESGDATRASVLDAEYARAYEGVGE